MDKQVIGVYDTQMETIEAIRELTSKGYKTDDITVITNKRDNDLLEGSLGTSAVDNGTHNRHEDESFWGRVKEFFEMDDTADSPNNQLADLDLSDEDESIYATHLDNGKYILAVEGEQIDLADEDGLLENDSAIGLGSQRDDSLMGSYSAADNNLTDTKAGSSYPNNEIDSAGEYKATNGSTYDSMTSNNSLRDSSRDDFLRTPMSNSRDLDGNMTDEEHKMKLHEERLDVNKTEVQTGEVSVNKEVYEEQETIEVPVKREEVYVERRSVNEEASNFNSDLNDDETIRVPIVEEQLEVTKKPVVTDEIVISKRTTEETKHVTDTVRKEEATLDKTGNPRVEGDQSLNSYKSTDDRY